MPKIVNRRTGTRVLDVQGGLGIPHLIIAAKARGVTLRCGKGTDTTCTWYVSTPRKHCWKPGLHSLKVHWIRGSAKARDQAIRKVIKKMEGLIPQKCGRGCEKCFG